MSLPAAASAFLAQAIEKYASGLIEPFKEAFYNEVIEGAARTLKLWAADKLSFFRHLLTGTMASLQRALPSGEWGYSPKGFEDVLVDMVTGSVMLAALVGEELAEEFFAEMIQEGTSNAIQTSFGGYFQTMLNIFRGGSPLNPDDIRDLYNLNNIIDEKILAVNAAGAGANYYATIHYIAAGGMENIDRSMVAGVNQIQQLTLRAIEHALFPQEYQVQLARRIIMDKLNNAMEHVDYWIQLAVDSIETAISRINDMINELDTAIDDYQASPPRITDNELDAITESIRKSFEKLKNNVDHILNKLQQYISSESPVVTDEEIQLYVDAVRNYATALATLATMINNKYLNLIQQLINFINKMANYIWAYRTYNPQATVAPPPPPTQGVEISPSYRLTIQVVEEE